MEYKQKGFVFFANFAETIKTLPEEKQALAYKALCEYGIYGTLPEDESLRIMCLMAQESIFKGDRRQLNGGNHNPSGKNQHTKTEETPNLVNSGQSRSILVNSGQFRSIGQSLYKEKEKEKKEEQEENIKGIDQNKNFAPPKLEELLKYAKEQNDFAGIGGFECSRYTAEQFWSHYQSCGWIVGNGIPMWDWKAKLREWCIKNKRQEMAKKEY